MPLARNWDEFVGSSMSGGDVFPSANSTEQNRNELVVT